MLHSGSALYAFSLRYPSAGYSFVDAIFRGADASCSLVENRVRTTPVDDRCVWTTGPGVAHQVGSAKSYAERRVLCEPTLVAGRPRSRTAPR